MFSIYIHAASGFDRSNCVGYLSRINTMKKIPTISGCIAHLEIEPQSRPLLNNPQVTAWNTNSAVVVFAVAVALRPYACSPNSVDVPYCQFLGIVRLQPTGAEG